MKLTLFSGLLAAALTLSTLPSQAIEVGQVAPAFELPARQGLLKSSDLKGRVVYLDFWASWCGPCKQSFQWMNEMNARYASKGLRIVGVNLDEKSQDANLFLGDNPASFDIAFDAKAVTPRQYGIKGMPTSLLIGPDGKVLMVHSGFKPAQRSELEQQIRQALNVKD